MINNNKQKQTKQIYAQIDRSLYDLLVSLKEVEGKSLRELLEKAIAEYVQKHRQLLRGKDLLKYLENYMVQSDKKEDNTRDHDKIIYN